VELVEARALGRLTEFYEILLVPRHSYSSAQIDYTAPKPFSTGGSRNPVPAREPESGGYRLGSVRFALKYPHTFYVIVVLILFLGVTAAVEMPTDIFAEIDIPVVWVIWQYTGLYTTEMEQHFTTYSQYAISSSVNGIKDIEAETVNGISVQKIYFPARCEPQSGDLSDRRRHERDPRIAANRDPTADRRAIQRFGLSRKSRSAPIT
jgi:hypothetical protein